MTREARESQAKKLISSYGKGIGRCGSGPRYEERVALVVHAVNPKQVSPPRGSLLLCVARFSWLVLFLRKWAVAVPRTGKGHELVGINSPAFAPWRLGGL